MDHLQRKKVSSKYRWIIWVVITIPKKSTFATICLQIQWWILPYNLLCCRWDLRGDPYSTILCVLSWWCLAELDYACIMLVCTLLNISPKCTHILYFCVLYLLSQRLVKVVTTLWLELSFVLVRLAVRYLNRSLPNYSLLDIPEVLAGVTEQLRFPPWEYDTLLDTQNVWYSDGYCSKFW